MNEFQTLGKILVVGGIVLLVVGLLLIFFGKIPYIGKLPGDITVKGKNYTIYFPLATSIIISIIISLILYLFRK
ncbi:hypothetical protein MROS_0726 [Melioribacter roseus P3M-2]|uniref:DUF2905 domain-containing protein n=1 Tax=Melioribacter roseus (strain DSM 23840 / JCM 17771 / VKM B-2668 / P3M-2) TaxID=1191523 RepID=I6ZY77_MELRP|nr:DUF2905 domain-containing protein [Melioribacter roseus]AFN73968.1 hypothetical protein MROS_0726 [Melioribacter roseus P3M-2]